MPTTPAPPVGGGVRPLRLRCDGPLTSRRLVPALVDADTSHHAQVNALVVNVSIHYSLFQHLSPCRRARRPAHRMTPTHMGELSLAGQLNRDQIHSKPSQSKGPELMCAGSTECRTRPLSQRHEFTDGDFWKCSVPPPAKTPVTYREKTAIVFGSRLARPSRASHSSAMV